VIYEVSKQCTIPKKEKINLRSKGYWWTHTSVCSSSLSVYVHEVSLCLCRELICLECMTWIRSACSLWWVFYLQDCISSRNLSGSDQLRCHIQVKQLKTDTNHISELTYLYCTCTDFLVGVVYESQALLLGHKLHGCYIA
jgi:hypothetical protein